MAAQIDTYDILRFRTKLIAEINVSPKKIFGSVAPPKTMNRHVPCFYLMDHKYDKSNTCLAKCLAFTAQQRTDSEDWKNCN